MRNSMPEPMHTIDTKKLVLFEAIELLFRRILDFGITIRANKNFLNETE